MGNVEPKFGTIVDMYNLKERIKDEIARQDMSVNKLAAMTGIPKSTIDSFLNSSTIPAFDRVYQITTALGLEIEDPQEAQEEEPAPPPDSHSYSSEYVTDMNEIHQQEKTEMRENQRYMIDAVREAYELGKESTQGHIISLKREKRIWCVLALILIAILCVWLAWDLMNPGVGLIRYNRSFGSFAKG